MPGVKAAVGPRVIETLTVNRIPFKGVSRLEHQGRYIYTLGLGCFVKERDEIQFDEKRFSQVSDDLKFAVRADVYGSYFRRSERKGRRGLQRREWQSLITVKNVKVSISTTFTLKDLSINVNTGSIYGLVGTNGSARRRLSNI